MTAMKMSRHLEMINDMKNTKIVELVIDEDSQELAIDAISLVSAPAIEQDFVFFGKEKNNLTFAKVDEEKRMLVSPALIPNKQIFRYDPNTDSEYYVYFSPETVRKASELYLKNNNHHKATHEHSERVSGVLTVESWIIEDTKKDKSTLYGFSLPKGTWMVKMKIENDELWNKIKSGELRGLSIEGYFTDKMQEMSSKQPSDADILIALNEIIRGGNKNKVELSLVGDIKKISTDLEKAMTTLNQSQKEARGIVIEINTDLDLARKALDRNYNDVESKIKPVQTLESKANTLLNQAEKAAKDLGLRLNDIPGYANLESLFDNTDTIISDADDVLNDISKIKV